jgi:hypothetical protein
MGLTWRNRMAIKIDGTATMFWSNKARAITAAKAIGWPNNSLVPVETRFQRGYALCQIGGELISREQYGEFYNSRNRGAA